MPTKMKKLALCFLLAASGLVLSGQTVKLSREKQILLFHNVDSLIKNYEFYSTLSEGNKISENQKEKFLTIFLNDTVAVFDDITPNYINNNERTINEKQKPVTAYVKDIGDNYMNLFCTITETDAGTLYSRITIENGYLVVPVKIRKETQAFVKNSSGARYETTSYQDLIITVKDSVSCTPLISGINKSGKCTWHYTEPFSRVSPWEKIISIKGSLVNIKYGNQVSESIISGQGVKSKPGFGLEYEFRYLFKNFESYQMGLSFGLGISYLSSNYSADSIKSATYTARDMDGDPYYELMNTRALNQKGTIYGFNLPVKLNYDKSLGQKSGFYLKLGAVLSYYMGSSKTTTTYTSQGYYPQHNITLGGIPTYGFNNNQPYSGKAKLPVNPFNVSGDVELGLFFRLKNKYQLYVGVNYDQAFLNFASKPNSTDAAKALLSINQADANKSISSKSIMSDMSTVNMSMIGITISIKKLAKSVSLQKNVNYMKPLN
jgi:hypothetical protein